MSLDQPAPTAEELEAAFAPDRPMAVGLEEEVMLLDPETLDLAPIAAEVVDAAPAGAPLKLELPASQVEITTDPPPPWPRPWSSWLPDGALSLRLRRARPAGLRRRPSLRGARWGAQPGRALRADARRLRARSAPADGVRASGARRRGRPRAGAGGLQQPALLPPELAALAANSPWHAGKDTGLASIRPKLVEALPRQGVPPEISSWNALAGELRWGKRVRHHPRAGSLVVGAAAPPLVRHAGDEGARRPDNARSRRGHRRILPRSGGLAGRAARRRRAAAGGPLVAHRREPVVGVALGGGGHAGRLGDRGAAPHPRAPHRAAGRRRPCG